MAKPKNPKKSQEAREKFASAIPTSEASGMLAETASDSVAAAPVSMSEAATSEPQKLSPRKSTKKPEIVKTESRSNLVPINLEDEIRQLAYLFSERRGFTPGHETEDWLTAEHEVMQRYHQHSA